MMRMKRRNGLLNAFWALVLTAALSPSAGWACSICYGDPDAPVSKGLSWAISALAVLVVIVMSGVVGFFVHTNRRAAEMLPGSEASAVPSREV